MAGAGLTRSYLQEISTMANFGGSYDDGRGSSTTVEVEYTEVIKQELEALQEDSGKDLQNSRQRRTTLLYII